MIGCVLAGALALAAPLAPQARANDVGAAIAAGVVGAAIGASLAKKSKSRHKHADDRFSPAAGVTCYRRQRACYKDGGGFAANWTHRIYG
jgi:hypothetical protein